MIPLSESYDHHAQQLMQALQESELLQNYLEEEDDNIYKQMIEGFEPHMQELYSLVAANDPLQLEALELKMSESAFEGLFLPRILGYAVMRAEVDDNYKYTKPHDHFKIILQTICNSANFELIKNRIGLTVQLGFALSSDIWITNFMESVDNKKVKSFLLQQRQDKYRSLDQRKALFTNYSKQFEGHNFLSTDIPTTPAQFNTGAKALSNFLKYRSASKFNNASLVPYMSDLISNASFHTLDGFNEIMILIGMFYDIPQDDMTRLSKYFDEQRKTGDAYVETYFKDLHGLYNDRMAITPNADKRMASVINKSIKDAVSGYYTLMAVVHTKGYVHEDTIGAVREYYDRHKGLSLENECLRDAIFRYCESFLTHLDVDSYHEYFEINKVYTSYINIFFNQKFNQKIKEISFDYVKKLLNHYTDKRSKDYQDIKKFVTSTFLDLNFKTEKELTELFKTKRTV